MPILTIFQIVVKIGNKKGCSTWNNNVDFKGGIIMKQNTKFLWMYILILFSFALILIVFAGLSKNNVDEEQKGLKQDITVLSKKNTELSTQISSLQTNIDELIQENENLKSENETLKNSGTDAQSTDELLLTALKEYDNKNYNKCREIISEVNPESVITETQKYIYNKLKNI